MRARLGTLLAACGAVFATLATSAAPAADDAASKFDPQLYRQTVQRGISYLTSKGQAPDGSFSGKISPAVTALCTSALLRNGMSPDDPAVAKSLKYLEGFVQKDGGIYAPGSSVRNYETSIALMCLVDANKDGRYSKLIDAANNYVKNIQWGADGKIAASDVKYGGAGYGKSGTRPDLSNTAFLVDALHSVGDELNSDALQRALVFVSRCQNLETEHNTTPFPAKNPDGGFYYTPADGGESEAGKMSDGGLRSYASMTYSGLKSMLYAGVAPDDERVRAAVKWIEKHYNLDGNPGMEIADPAMAQAGLYYGYHTFAKALAALGRSTLIDDKGVEHDWRADLVAALAQRQKEDGSWSNAQKRWMEGDPNLVTAYSLLALSYCRPSAP